MSFSDSYPTLRPNTVFLFNDGATRNMCMQLRPLDADASSLMEPWLCYLSLIQFQSIVGWFHEGSMRHVDHVHLINSSRDHVQRVTWTQHGGDNKIIFRKTEDLRFQIRSARDTSTCPTSVLITTIQTQSWLHFPSRFCEFGSRSATDLAMQVWKRHTTGQNRVTKLIQQVKQYVRGWNHSVIQ